MINLITSISNDPQEYWAYRWFCGGKWVRALREDQPKYELFAKWYQLPTQEKFYKVYEEENCGGIWVNHP